MKALALLCLTAGAVFGQYTVGGTVVSAATGSPVGHARVTLAPDKTRDLKTGQFTDSNGRFRFENVAAGKYVLAGSSNTFPEQMFGMKRLYLSAGVLVVTGPGQNTTGLRFPLISPSTISGKVLDEFGEPVRDALVQLIYSGFVVGRKSVRQYRYSWTNAVGEYRISALPSGQYYVAVSGVPWYAGKGEPPAGALKRGYAAVYYPNTSSPAAASTLKLGAGEEAVANFTVSAVPASNLIVHLPPAKASETRLLHLVSENATGLETFHRSQQVSGSQCQLAGVLPGRYTARLRGMESQGRTVASLAFEVTGSDREVTLEAVEPVKVSGVVDAGSVQAEAIQSCVIHLVDEEQKSGFTRPLDLNGAFSVPSVPPGTYEVHVDGCRYVRIRTVEAEGAKAAGSRVELKGAPVRMKIHAERADGTVRGVVYRDAKPVIGVTVLLAPKDESKYSGQLRSFITDSDGSYDFTGVVPGEYLMLAVEDGEFMEYSSPPVLRPYLKQAQAVAVVAGRPADTRIELP